MSTAAEICLLAAEANARMARQWAPVFGGLIAQLLARAHWHLVIGLATENAQRRLTYTPTPKE